MKPSRILVLPLIFLILMTPPAHGQPFNVGNFSISPSGFPFTIVWGVNFTYGIDLINNGGKTNATGDMGFSNQANSYTICGFAAIINANSGIPVVCIVGRVQWTILTTQNRMPGPGVYNLYATVNGTRFIGPDTVTVFNPD